MDKVKKAFIASLMTQLRIEPDPFAENLIKKALTHVRTEDYGEFYEKVFMRNDFVGLDRILNVSNIFLVRISNEIEELKKKAHEKYIMLTEIKKDNHIIYKHLIKDINNLLKIERRDGGKYFSEKEMSFIVSIGGLPITMNKDDFIKSYTTFISNIKNEVQIKAIEYKNNLGEQK